MNQQPKLSIVMPCYGRPERTKRSLECVINQSLVGWELFFIGDCCPHYEKLIQSSWFQDIIKNLNKQNKIIFYNLDKNYGGYGYHIMNLAIQNCTGEYFMFCSNDDVIDKNHFYNYYNEIKKSKNDFMYFNSYVRYNNIFTVRLSKLEKNHCGHSELIIKSSLLKTLPPHGKEYGHDFTLIKNLLSSSTNYSKSNKSPSYYVMSMPHMPEQGID